ncbi:AcrR family transcriptional regulator [Inhella inkyongensis]|uniref:AcrR family transcriptional regulator n=1 Tax=Inhella inkyongensis TaxID=392593 RepID=A0A840S9X6_9BURK|nr:TetR/AcrR family transcriptional regulator [Inhella inkyongensis]MBB5206328.1 AcrR family transcriptional regulator [Inhella inkyongensis]
MNEANAPPKRSVGRPRAFDREQALELALDRFWRHGFEGVSTNTLCEAMGIKPPSLYAAFGSKEALYRECLDLYAQRHSGYFTEALAAELPLREALEQMLRGAARQYAAPDHALGCMFASGGLHGAPEHAAVFQALSERRLQAQGALLARLKRAKGAGELREGADLNSLAAYFATVIQGMAIQARDGAKAPALQRVGLLALAALDGVLVQPSGSHDPG